jgi:hypothetical protein
MTSGKEAHGLVFYRICRATVLVGPVTAVAVQPFAGGVAAVELADILRVLFECPVTLAA